MPRCRRAATRFHRETPLDHEPARRQPGGGGCRHRRPGPPPARDLKVGVLPAINIACGRASIEARRRSGLHDTGAIGLATAGDLRRSPGPGCRLTTRGENDVAIQERESLAGLRRDPRRCGRSSHRRPALDYPGQVAVEVAAIQSQADPGIDLVTAAAIRLAGALLPSSGDFGRFARESFSRWITSATWAGCASLTNSLLESTGAGEIPRREVALPVASQINRRQLRRCPRWQAPHLLCCPADQALDTVRLLEAIARSAATGQIIRLI